MFVHRLSKFFISDGSSSSNSSDEVGGCVHKDDLQYLDKLFHSSSPVDKRFLSMFEIMRRKKSSLPIGSQLSNKVIHKEQNVESNPSKQSSSKIVTFDTTSDLIELIKPVKEKKAALKAAFTTQTNLLNSTEVINTDEVHESENSDAILDEIYRTLEDWKVPEMDDKR